MNGIVHLFGEVAGGMPRLIQKNVVLAPAVYFSAHGKPVASSETSVIA